ncbi:hypothetical protein DV737_g1440, partial [Chaetothyriales sp. CBS 132003]
MEKSGEVAVSVRARDRRSGRKRARGPNWNEAPSYAAPPLATYQPRLAAVGTAAAHFTHCRTHREVSLEPPHACLLPSTLGYSDHTLGCVHRPTLEFTEPATVSAPSAALFFICASERYNWLYLGTCHASMQVIGPPACASPVQAKRLFTDLADQTTHKCLSGRQKDRSDAHLGPSYIIRDVQMSSIEQMPVSIPAYYLNEPPLVDNLATETSDLQQKTIDECLPLLGAAFDASKDPGDFNAFGVPDLSKADHIAFLERNLATFPAHFVGLDASRPWMIYWALLGLHLLGEDVTQKGQRVRKTFYPLQNATGGFGGGYGHYSHLAGTYATLLSIALVGGEDTYAMIDRKAMWHWLGRLKQCDGGFQICQGGEEDVRGALCALVIVSLLDLPLELPPDAPSRSAGFSTFNDGLGDFIARCQTYEGGISASPGLEAHGAYAFCSIACLCLLGDPHITLFQYLDLPALLAWLSSRQYAPEGGIAGRTNKVVDGCYSHWVEPRYFVTRGSNGFRCTVRVNNREYQTPRIQQTESTAREEAALIAFNICRSFSANDGMYPTGFAHDGVIQGNPVPVGSGRHTTRHGSRQDSRGSNSSLDNSEYHYTSDSTGSRSGGSSPDYTSPKNPWDRRQNRFLSGSARTAARKLNQQSVDHQLADYDAIVAEQQDKQQKRPWHRDGADEPPSRERRSAGAMTKGKLVTTPSRLLKLVMPLTTVGHNSDCKDIAPLALLIHPQQPLSYLERLVQAELPTITNEKGDSRIPSVAFRAMEASNDQIQPEKKAEAGMRDDDGGGLQGYTGDGREGKGKERGQFVKWSASTEIGDFIRDAARAKEFEIEIEGRPGVIKVAVPSFNDRTFYLRQRLRQISSKISGMAKIKQECDEAAHKTAQRIAVSGCGMLVAYWCLVYRLTFETDLGWDAVEPITYLVGLSTLIGGYMWFLWHNREVSYRQAMQITISRRQSRMYELKGFDLHKWEALLEEANAIRREIMAVASEYGVEWDEREDEGDKAVTKALRHERRNNGSPDKKTSKDEGEDEKNDDEKKDTD